MFVFVSPFLRSSPSFGCLVINLSSGKKVTSLRSSYTSFDLPSSPRIKIQAITRGLGLERVPLLVGRAGHDRARPAAGLGKRRGAGEEKEEEEEEEERERERR